MTVDGVSSSCHTLKLRGVVAIIKENAAHVTHMIMWVQSHGETAMLYAGDFLGFSRSSIGVLPTSCAPTVTFGLA